MEIILHRDYSCAPEGHTTHHFRAGDTLTGRAAHMADAEGAGFTPVVETKVEPPIEVKRGRARGNK